MKRLRLWTESFCILPVYLFHTCHTLDMKGGMDMESLLTSLIRETGKTDPTILAIREVCASIDAAQRRFEQECDPDFIESTIYELQSLRARYRYLLRTARERGVSCQEKVYLWNE